MKVLSATRLFVHKTVNHMQEYVRGDVHTQGIENFWSLLKRTLKGTYVAVEPFHLDSYLNEQVFRFNNSGKKMNDTLRFEKAMGNVGGSSPDVQRAYRHWQCYLTLRCGRDVVNGASKNPSVPLLLLPRIFPNS